MKSLTLLLAMFLIGLGIPSKLLAQTDLDYVNNSSCSVTLDFFGLTNCCSITSSTGNSIPAGPSSSGTLTTTPSLSCSLLEVFQVIVHSGTTDKVGDPSSCAGSFVRSIYINDCAGGILNLNLYFTPATSTVNASILIQ